MVSFGCFVNMVEVIVWCLFVVLLIWWGVIVWCLLVVLLIWWGLLCGVFCEVCEALSGFLKGEGSFFCFVFCFFVL